MNINRNFCTKIALVLLGFSPIFWNTDPAHAVTGSLNLDNEDFTFISGQDNGVNNAAGNSNIDETATPQGFGNHFSDSDTFLLLGATDPSSNISSSPASQNVTAFSEQFEIDSRDIQEGVVVEFDWAFQGTDDESDSFVVRIINSSESDIATVITENSYGQGSYSGIVDVSDFSGGSDYSLFVTLNEGAFDGKNSAAGFNNISVSVPFEFSPGLGLLMMGGLFGGSTYLKRRKLASKIALD